MQKLKNILVLFLIMLTSAVYAESETITVISDAHINVDKQNNTATKSIRNLMKAIDQANVNSSSAVVFLGDNIQSADKIYLAMFAKITDRLKKPYYTVAGNRDIAKSKDLTVKEYYRILNKFSSNKTKTIPSYATHDGLLFVFMSGVNETFPTYKGYYKNKEVEYLDKVLTKNKDKKVIIFQHFPVVFPKNDTSRETAKANLYLDVLDKHHNVLAVVSGHYHMEDVIERNKVKHISVGALGQSGEYEQIKIYKNKDGSYTVVPRALNID